VRRQVYRLGRREAREKDRAGLGAAAQGQERGEGGGQEESLHWRTTRGREPFSRDPGCGGRPPGLPSARAGRPGGLPPRPGSRPNVELGWERRLTSPNRERGRRWVRWPASRSGG